MPARHAAPPDRLPGDRLVVVGAGVFALGAVALLAVVLPYFFSHPDLPLWLNVASFLAPVGLGLALLGLLRQARAARARARTSAARSAAEPRGG